MDNMTASQIGAIGLHAVGAIFSSMDWIFRPQPERDIGIDAFIETSLSDNGQPAFVGLQIKCGPSYFTEQTDAGFKFRSTSRLLQYWTTFPVPILIVIYHPHTEKAYWQHVSRDTITATDAAGWIWIPKNNMLNVASKADILRACGFFQDRSASEVIDILFKIFSRADIMDMTERYALVNRYLLSTPYDAHMLLIKANIEFMRGEFQSALDTFKASILINPLIPEAYWGIARTCRYVPEADNAVYWSNKGIEIDPMNSYGYYTRAHCLFYDGDLNAAIADLDRAIDIDEKIYDAYYLRGNAFLKLGKFEKAIDDFRNLIKFSPFNPLYYDKLGVAYQSCNLLDDAQLTFQKAVELDPEYEPAKRSLEKLRVAEQIMDIRMKLDGSVNVDKLFTLAILYYENDDYNEAEVLFRKILMVEPQHFGANVNLAVLIAGSKRDYALANIFLDSAVSSHPDSEVVWFNKGYVALMSEEFEAAISALSKAIEINRTDAQAYFLRGTVYHKMRDINNSINDLTRALELDPFLDQARSLRRKLLDIRASMVRGRYGLFYPRVPGVQG